MSTFLITGSNRGIGLELCKQIISRGDEVIATCRKASSELKNLSLRIEDCLLYTSPSPRDRQKSRMPSSA